MFLVLVSVCRVSKCQLWLRTVLQLFISFSGYCLANSISFSSKSLLTVVWWLEIMVQILLVRFKGIFVSVFLGWMTKAGIVWSQSLCSVCQFHCCCLWLLWVYPGRVVLCRYIPQYIGCECWCCLLSSGIRRVWWGCGYKGKGNRPCIMYLFQHCNRWR